VEIALVTYPKLPDLSPDDHPLRDALRARSAGVRAVSWDAPGVDWARFDAVVLRSCWDYHLRFAEFGRWLDTLEQVRVRLWNPARVVRWNFDKSYLRALDGDGVLLPATEWLASGAAPDLAQLLVARGWQEAVVKPQVSASAHETWRTDRRQAPSDQPRLERLLRSGGVLVQEFVPEVVTAGELSLVYIAGEFSHAVRKRVGTGVGEFRVQERFGGWSEPATAGMAAREAGSQVLSRVPGPWLYARVDGVERAGRFLVMELEVFEPQLFLAFSPAAAQRLAAAIIERS
jgi:hypothetical protein